MAKKVIVCGGRDFSDWEKLNQTLDSIFEERGWMSEPDEYGNCLPVVHIIHGGAEGADTLADNYAVMNWCVVTEYPALWDKYGKSAGPIRNKQMLDEGEPDLVIAFPGGKGTNNMIKQANGRGIEIINVE